jgi:hypothetical protein
MKIYQDEHGDWRIETEHGRISQVFPSKEAAEKYAEERRRGREAFDRMMEYPGKIIPVGWLKENAKDESVWCDRCQTYVKKSECHTEIADDDTRRFICTGCDVELFPPEPI